MEVLTLTPPPGRPLRPIVAVTANVHGDECTGIGAILRLAQQLETRLLRGTVHLYPSLNPGGLEQQERRVPEDEQDLNRCFPGDITGNPSERQAGLIWTELISRRPELLIDLHADAPQSIPYVILDRALSLHGLARRTLEARAADLADATGLTVIHEYPDGRYRQYRLDRSLTGAALNHLQIPALTIEAGPRLYLHEPSVQAMLDGVLGPLYALEMVAQRAAPHPTRVDGGPWRRDAGPRASTSGLLLPRITPGRFLHHGSLIAEIRGMSGAVLEEIRSNADGFVLSHAERAHVAAGVPICTYAMMDGDKP